MPRSSRDSSDPAADREEELAVSRAGGAWRGALPPGGVTPPGGAGAGPPARPAPAARFPDERRLPWLCMSSG